MKGRSESADRVWRSNFPDGHECEADEETEKETRSWLNKTWLASPDTLERMPERIDEVFHTCQVEVPGVRWT